MYGQRAWAFGPYEHMSQARSCVGVWGRGECPCDTYLTQPLDPGATRTGTGAHTAAPRIFLVDLWLEVLFRCFIFLVLFLFVIS